MDRWILITLGIFMLLYGIFAVTNLRVEWSGPLMGFSALVCGIICIVRVIKATP